MGVKPDTSCNKAGIQESEIEIIDAEMEHEKRSSNNRIELEGVI
jgi:hypothetical protein